MDGLVSAIKLIGHLDVWLLCIVVCTILVINFYTIPVRKTLFRIVRRSGGQCLPLIVCIAVYAVIPACLAGWLAVYLLPCLMHTTHPLSMRLLYYGSLPILRLAMIPAFVAALGVTVPYSRRFVCRHPFVVESITAVTCFVFFAHHALYSGYPSLMESSVGQRIIPSLIVIFAIFLFLCSIFLFAVYSIDRSISGWYAPRHSIRKRVIPALCAILIQCLPLLIISQLICYRLETAFGVDAGVSCKQASYERYVELFMYEELYKMIDADTFGRQLFDAVSSDLRNECRRYRTVTARSYNLPDNSPLDTRFSSNSWRHVVLWYNTR